jgi:hypothetical protein
VVHFLVCSPRASGLSTVATGRDLEAAIVSSIKYVPIYLSSLCLFFPCNGLILFVSILSCYYCHFLCFFLEYHSYQRNCTLFAVIRNTGRFEAFMVGHSTSKWGEFAVRLDNQVFTFMLITKSANLSSANGASIQASERFSVCTLLLRPFCFFCTSTSTHKWLRRMVISYGHVLGKLITINWEDPVWWAQSVKVVKWNFKLVLPVGLWQLRHENWKSDRLRFDCGDGIETA